MPLPAPGAWQEAMTNVARKTAPDAEERRSFIAMIGVASPQLRKKV
jgi:hypothetical protein